MRLPRWFRRPHLISPDDEWRNPEPTFELEQVKKIQRDSYQVGYNDGKRKGIAISREIASKHLKELLWQSNQNRSLPKQPTQKQQGRK